MTIPDAQGAELPEGNSGLPAREVGEGRLHPAGCTTFARRMKTAQEPGRPAFLLGEDWQHGEPEKNLRRATRQRTHELPAERQRTSARAEVGERQGETGAFRRRKRGSRRVRIWRGPGAGDRSWLLYDATFPLPTHHLGAIFGRGTEDAVVSDEVAARARNQRNGAGGTRAARSAARGAR